jgi:hypothetical protein
MRRTMICAVASAGLILSGLTLAQPAAAAPCTGYGCSGGSETGGDGSGWGARAYVTVTIDGAGGTKVGSTRVPGPTPYCRYHPYDNADEIQPATGHGDDIFDYRDLGYDPETRLPPDVEERKGTEGRYWTPGCGLADWPGSDEARDAYVAEFFENNTIRWVGPADPLPPEPPVPAAVLLEIAKEHLEPPQPVIGVNPDAMSFVNLETWVWADPATFGDLEVRAESGPNWAQVDAKATGLSLTTSAAAQGKQVGTCATGGTEYDRSRPASAQSTDCAIVFGRSTAIAPAGWPLQVSSTWEATGSTSDGEVEVLVPVVASATENVDVAEFQAQVDRVGT